MPGYEADVPPNDPDDYVSLMRRMERVAWILPLPENASDSALLDHRPAYTLVGQWRMDQVVEALGKIVSDFDDDEFYRVTADLEPPRLALGETAMLVALARVHFRGK